MMGGYDEGVEFKGEGWCWDWEVVKVEMDEVCWEDLVMYNYMSNLGYYFENIDVVLYEVVV